MAKKPEILTEEHVDELLKDPTIAVKYAYLHQSITWPGVCGSEKTLSDARVKGIKMFSTVQGLLLLHKGKKCLVPHTNVVNYVLE